MVAQDLATGDTVPVVCTLYPLKLSSSTSTELFEGMSVKIIAFQDGKDAFRHQVNFKYHGGLRGAYLCSQTTKPPRKVQVSRRSGLMRLGNTLSFREWCLDLSTHPKGSQYGEWLWNIAEGNRGLKMPHRQELRAYVGEKCPYFVWDPEPMFKAN